MDTITIALGLEGYEQDWGICNADPNRVEDFLDFYNSHVPAHPSEREDLGELILASADRAIKDGILTPRLRARVVAFLRERHPEFPIESGYWLGLDEHEFPVVSLFREATR